MFELYTASPFGKLTLEREGRLNTSESTNKKVNPALTLLIILTAGAKQRHVRKRVGKKRDAKDTDIDTESKVSV